VIRTPDDLFLFQKLIMNRSALLLLLWVIFLFGCSIQKDLPVEKDLQKAKNVILLIGDGMGIAQMSTPFYFSDSMPHFSRFNHIGLHKNEPTSHKITDSAAGATAFSTGYKTYNGAIAVDSDTVPLKTILEMASEHGQKTGVISTSSITHATPASFFAHVKYRKMEEEIAEQLSKSSVDFIAGGGHKFFFDREDGQNLWPVLESNGFIIDTSEFLHPRVLDYELKYAFLPAYEAMPMMTEGRGDFLPHATEQALEYLSQHKKGFFLIVEGSQIDWGGHANDSEYIIQETLDFDRAVGKALDFAEKDGNTLVVVTADHETGGYALSSVEVRRQRDYAHIQPTFSTGGHTASLIPVLAFGPEAHRFTGFMENNDIFYKLLEAYQWNNE
jgi:alkaline phosphatase